jgi:hypothetical protein
MSAQKFFIRTADIKDRGYIQPNAEDSVLRVILQRVQDMEIQPLLGTALYTKLLNDCPTYSGIYLTLVNEHLVNVLITACEIRAVVHYNYKIRNKSVGTANDEHVRAGSPKEMDDLRVQLEADAAFYKQRLTAFLKQNKTIIPEYTEAQECHDIEPVKDTTASRLKII